MAAEEPDRPTAGQGGTGTQGGQVSGERSPGQARPEGTGTSTGLDSTQAAAVAYVLGALTGVLMLVLEDDEFVRFHAVQSIALTVVAIGVYAVLAIVTTVFAFVPFVGGLFVALFGLVYLLVGLVGFGVWLLAMYRAYSGEWFEFPVVGGFARRY